MMLVGVGGRVQVAGVSSRQNLECSILCCWEESEEVRIEMGLTCVAERKPDGDVGRVRSLQAHLELKEDEMSDLEGKQEAAVEACREQRRESGRQERDMDTRDRSGGRDGAAGSGCWRVSHHLLGLVRVPPKLNLQGSEETRTLPPVSPSTEAA
eukprot:766122-Hanusia_phi.AAC.4